MIYMKIVVLDGYGLNPGDLSWTGIEELGETIIYDRTSPEELMERAKDADILLTNKTVLKQDAIDNLPNLKYIGVLATGYNIIDLAAAGKHGIIVTNIPAYSTASVAQMVFAHLLNIVNRVSCHSEQVKKGRWSANKDFCFWDTPQQELAGKTMGLIGLGNTGMATARIAQAFGMNVIALTSKTQDQLPEGIIATDKEALFRNSDVISLHCPLTPDTRHLINAETIALMKPTAIVINTGRGPLINEQDLADALNSRRIYAAGVDVLSSEPPKVDNPLLTANHCFITPHIAWATLEARQRLMKIATDNIKAFIAGTPVNMVGL